VYECSVCMVVYVWCMSVVCVWVCGVWCMSGVCMCVCECMHGVYGVNHLIWERLLWERHKGIGPRSHLHSMSWS